MKQMILEAMQIIDNMIAEYRKREKEIKKLYTDGKISNIEAVAFVTYIYEIIEKLEKTKKYLKSLKE